MPTYELEKLTREQLLQLAAQLKRRKEQGYKTWRSDEQIILSPKSLSYLTDEQKVSFLGGADINPFLYEMSARDRARKETEKFRTRMEKEQKKEEERKELKTKIEEARKAKEVTAYRPLSERILNLGKTTVGFAYDIVSQIFPTTEEWGRWGREVSKSFTKEKLEKTIKELKLPMEEQRRRELEGKKSEMGSLMLMPRMFTQLDELAKAHYTWQKSSKDASFWQSPGGEVIKDFSINVLKRNIYNPDTGKSFEQPAYAWRTGDVKQLLSDALIVYGYWRLITAPIKAVKKIKAPAEVVPVEEVAKPVGELPSARFYAEPPTRITKEAWIADRMKTLSQIDKTSSKGVLRDRAIREFQGQRIPGGGVRAPEDYAPLDKAYVKKMAKAELMRDQFNKGSAGRFTKVQQPPSKEAINRFRNRFVKEEITPAEAARLETKNPSVLKAEPIREANRQTALAKEVIEGLPDREIGRLGIISYGGAPYWRMTKAGLQDIYLKVRERFVGMTEEQISIDRITYGYAKSVEKIPGAPQRIALYLEGLPTDRPLTPKELSAAKAYKVMAGNLADRGGIPIEKRIPNYMTHIFKNTLEQMDKFDARIAKDTQLGGIMFGNVSDDVTAMRTVAFGKKVFNPFELKRLGRTEGLITDPFVAMRAYSRATLRKIYLEEPLTELRGIMNTSEMPQSTRLWLNKWVNYDVLQRVHPWDIATSETIRGGVRAGGKVAKAVSLDEKYSALFNEKLNVRGNVAGRIGLGIRKGAYSGTMWANPTPALKNASQQLIAGSEVGGKWQVYGLRRYVKAIAGKDPEAMDILRKSNIFRERMIESVGMEGLRPIGKIERAAMLPFDTIEQSNVGSTVLAGYYKALTKGATPAKAIEAGNLAGLRTQFGYLAIDRPLFMKSWVGGLAGQYQTFPINLSELVLNWVQNPSSGGWVKMGKWLAGTAATVYVANEMGVDIKDIYIQGIVPDRPAPGLQLLYNIGGATVNFMKGDEEEAREYANKLTQQAPAFIPFGVPVKRAMKALELYAAGEEYDYRNRMRREVSKMEAIQRFFVVSSQQEEYYQKIDWINQLKRIGRDERQMIYDLIFEGKWDEAESRAKKIGIELKDTDINAELERRTTKEAIFRLVDGMPKHKRDEYFAKYPEDVERYYNYKYQKLLERQNR